MHLITQKYKCKFFLSDWKNNQEQEILKEILIQNLKMNVMH